MHCNWDHRFAFSPVYNANIGAPFAVLGSQQAKVMSLAVGATDGSIDLAQTEGTARKANIRNQLLAFTIVCYTNVAPRFAVMGIQPASI